MITANEIRAGIAFAKGSRELMDALYVEVIGFSPLEENPEDTEASIAVTLSEYADELDFEESRRED